MPWVNLISKGNRILVSADQTGSVDNFYNLIREGGGTESVSTSPEKGNIVGKINSASDTACYGIVVVKPS